MSQVDLLDRLRTVKERRHYTYQDIVDLTEQNGEPVSMTTVRRVFAKDAQLENFRYNQTVAPIVRVLLESGNEPAGPAWAEEAQTDEIERLRQELEMAKQHEREVIEKAQQGVQTQIDNLIAERKVAYRRFRIAAIALGALIVVSIILDLAIGSVGFIRY